MYRLDAAMRLIYSDGTSVYASRGDNHAKGKIAAQNHIPCDAKYLVRRHVLASFLLCETLT